MRSVPPATGRSAGSRSSSSRASGRLAGLTTAVTSYNRAVGSMESRVLVSARRFRELGSGSSKDITELDGVEASPRPLTATEFRLPPLLAVSGDGGDAAAQDRLADGEEADQE